MYLSTTHIIYQLMNYNHYFIPKINSSHVVLVSPRGKYGLSFKEMECFVIFYIEKKRFKEIDSIVLADKGQ